MNALLRPDSAVVRLGGGATWSEGPVYLKQEDALIWSDIPGNRLLRWSAREGVAEFLKPSHFQNGHCLDRGGRIIACSHGQRAILRREGDADWRVLVDQFNGKKLNSPNDVVVKSDGTIWFTDPPYGLIQENEGYGGQREQPGNYVYRFDPERNEIEVVVSDVQMPNGLAFSPDETTLYVSDTSVSHLPNGNHHIRAYDLIDGRRPVDGRVFAVVAPGLPDGFRLDEAGNLFTSSYDGVQVYSSTGERIGQIPVPEHVGNLTFGGPDGSYLFIAATTSLYGIQLTTKGAAL